MTSSTTPFYCSDTEFTRLLEDYARDNAAHVRSKKTRKVDRRVIRGFRRWLLAKNLSAIDEQVVLEWMAERSRTRSELTLSQEASRVNRFLAYLVNRALIPANPFRSLREKCRTCGVRGLARTIKTCGENVLQECLADQPFSGPLGAQFLGYLDHLKALGRKMDYPRWMLSTFDRYLRQSAICDWQCVTLELVRPYLEGWSTNGLTIPRRRLATLHGFFQYLVGHETVRESPIPELLPAASYHWHPHIFSREDIERILDAAGRLPDHHRMPYRGPTYRLIFLLLYALGLRINETLNIRIRDIDFVENSITLNNTKFGKGRVLPFGPRLGGALKTHLREHPELKSVSSDACIFPSRSRNTLHVLMGSCRDALIQIAKELNIPGGKNGELPRLHSFRHSFAVHRIERWHREVADLGAKLPLLSAFLGHVNVSSSQAYLSMTPERLKLVGDRFEAAFGEGGRR